MRAICLLSLPILCACSGDKAAEKPAEKAKAVPDPGGVDSPQPAEKPGIDGAPGAPASKSGAPPWVVVDQPGQGACREADGALDCSGVSPYLKDRTAAEKQALDAALGAMSAKAGVPVEAIAAARGRQPDDVWWIEMAGADGNDAPDFLVYVRARMSADQRQALTK